VVVLSVDRIEVVDGGVDPLVLVAKLQAMGSDHLRVVDLRIDDERILELRIAWLAAKLGIASDVLRVQRTNDCRVGREPGDSGRLQNSRRTRADRRLSAFGPGDA